MLFKELAQPRHCRLNVIATPADRPSPTNHRLTVHNLTPLELVRVDAVTDHDHVVTEL